MTIAERRQHRRVTILAQWTWSARNCAWQNETTDRLLRIGKRLRRVRNAVDDLAENASEWDTSDVVLWFVLIIVVFWR